MGNSRRVPSWVLVLGLGIALAAAMGFRANPLTERAKDYVGGVAVASAATYVTLRSLNAVLSSVQEIEVGGSLVVSGTAQPLKVLEPIDDTIERISDVVFAIMLVSGVVSVATGPVSAVGAILVALAMLLWLADRAIGSRNPTAVLAWRLSWYGLFLGLGLPLALILSSVLADRLTEETWQDHQAIIDEIMIGVDAVPLEATMDQSWAEWFRDVSGDAGRYRDVVANVFDRADDLIRSFIAILSVYIFKIFLLPILVAGAVLLFVRHYAMR